MDINWIFFCHSGICEINKNKLRHIMRKPVVGVVDFQHFSSGLVHYENKSMQHTAIFHAPKNDNFHLKCFDYFLILAQ